MHGYAGAPIQLDANMGWVNAVQEIAAGVAGYGEAPAGAGALA